MTSLLATTSYDPGMRPMSLSGSPGPAGPPTSAYPAVPTQRLLSPQHAPSPVRAADQQRYRDDFRHGGREARPPGSDSRGWNPRAPNLEQERYQAPPTQRLDDDQCDDECLDADHCGAENRPPNPENLVCGMDVRPLLPVALAVSTVLGALLMILVQIPMLSRLIGVSEASLSCTCVVLYAVTLGCMTYCAFCDPGQMRRGIDVEPPARSHQTWQYKRPIRRYDHYCRWLTNCIGLLNHREFVIMLVGLVTIGLIGVAVDLTLVASMVNKSWWQTLILVALHLGYSVALIALALPILRIHVGLVSRNELASEWKRNDFYIARNTKKGKDVSVNELSDDEFNALFDEFVYDETKNVFDHGCFSNCLRFWCESRWAPGDTGSF